MLLYIVGGALLLLGQYFPNAAVSLVVVDSGGIMLGSGTKLPGEAPGRLPLAQPVAVIDIGSNSLRLVLLAPERADLGVEVVRMPRRVRRL